MKGVVGVDAMSMFASHNMEIAVIYLGEQLETCSIPFSVSGVPDDGNRKVR